MDPEVYMNACVCCSWIRPCWKCFNFSKSRKTVFLISLVHFTSLEHVWEVCLCQLFSYEICVLSLSFSSSWHVHFPFALPITFLFTLTVYYPSFFSLYPMCLFLVFHYCLSSLPFLPFISPSFSSYLQRRCRNCRSTLPCWGRSMWRCSRSWWRRRGGAPCWPPRSLSPAPPPRPVTPSSAACWPSWLTFISKSSTGEHWMWTVTYC